MALHSLCGLGVVLLLNFAHEVHGFQNTFYVQNGDYMQHCMEPELNYEVEFHRVRMEGGKLYRRWVIDAAAWECITESFYTEEEQSGTDMRECLEYALQKGYKSFAHQSDTCGFLTTSIPEEFLKCGPATDDDVVVYTTSDRPDRYTLPDGGESSICEVTQDAESSITLKVYDSCDPAEYVIRYSNPPGEDIISAYTPIVLNQPLAECQVVNFTVYRIPEEVPLCEATLVSNPGTLTGSIAWENLMVVVRLPNCEFLLYTVEYTSCDDCSTTVSDPKPTTGQVLTFPNLGESTVTIVFSSDYDIHVPPPLTYYVPD